MNKYFLPLFLLSSINAFCQNSAAKGDSLFAIGQYSSAIVIYEAYLTTNKTDALEWNRLGYCYQVTGSYDKAIQAFQQSLNNKPSPFLKQLVESRMARIYALQNEKEKSFNLLNKALSDGYANTSELDTNRDFSSIRNDSRFASLRQHALDNAYPCMQDSHAREFDFWVGEWNVYPTGANNLVGHSKIDIASGGCMILENWTATGVPNNGKSMNFVDPATNKWEQVWVGSGGGGQNVGRFTMGEYRDSAMRFTFSLMRQGVNLQGRFIFFNQGPNQVRQFQETSADGGKTWTTVYDLTYKRITK